MSRFISLRPMRAVRSLGLILLAAFSAWPASAQMPNPSLYSAPFVGSFVFVSPTLSGTVTGTYTLAGTVTIPAPGPFGDTTSVVLGTGAGAAQNTNTLNNVIIGNGAAPLLTSFSNSVIIGAGAGAAVTAVGTNTQSVFIGRNAGAANTSGGFNIFIGNNAGVLNAGGAESTCIGWQACASTTSGGFLNAVGTSALNAQTGTGVAMGTDALKFYNNAQPSVAFGNNAGKNTVGGGNSTFIGTSAGASWTQNSGTINSNLAIGDTAFDGNNGSISQISRNIAIGNNTMLAHAATTLMSDNIAIGHNGAQGLTSGIKNVLIGGGNVGQSITAGGSNVAIGYNVASANLTTGSNNVFIGTSASLVASNVSNNIGIGTSSTPVWSVTGGDVPSTSVTTIAGLATITGAATLSSTLTYGGVALTNAVTGTGKMVLDASATLTGIPTAPTAAQGTNTTQLATTAFVQSSVSGAYFKAYLGANQTVSSGAETVILFDTVAYDVGSYYNTGTGKYTPLVSGIYEFGTCVQVSANFTLTANNAIVDMLSDAVRYSRNTQSLPTLLGDASTLCETVTRQMNGSTDLMKVSGTFTTTAAANAIVVSGLHQTFFYGIRIGPQ